ncbi:MAG: hypothetical protein RJB68_1585 [Pseudomonadota bacterium]
MEPQHPHRATSRDKLFGMLGGNTRPAPLPGASDSLLGAADAGGHRYIRGIR